MPVLAACGGGDTPWSPALSGDSVSVSLTLCANPLPAFFAHQLADGSWASVVSDANGTFVFNSTPKAAVLYVMPDASGFSTHLVYATSAELATLTPACPAAAARTLHGTVSHLPPNADAIVAMGNVSSSGTAFDMTSVPGGSLDLFAEARVPSGADYDVASVILRRGLNPADGATFPDLDFNGAEATGTAAFSLTIGGLDQAETTSVRNYFSTATTSPQAYVMSHGSVTSSPTSFLSVPGSITQTGDLQTLSVDAWSNGNATMRGVALYYRVPQNVVLGLPPGLFAPTVNVLAGTTPSRVLVRFNRQAEYATLAYARYAQTDPQGHTWKWDVVMTDGYNPSSSLWSLTMPDVAQIANFPDAGLRGGMATTLGVGAVGGSLGWYLGNRAHEGDVVRHGLRVSQIVTTP